MTFTEDPLKLTVIADDEQMDGDYPLRLVATLNAKPDKTATTDFVLTVIYDPCYGTEVQSNPLPTYMYNVDLGNSETIAALDWS